MSGEQDPTGYEIPEDAEALGVAGLFQTYNETRAASITDPSEENAEAFKAAQAKLSDARAYWRGIRLWVAEVAYREWAEANPEAAAAAQAEVES